MLSLHPNDRDDHRQQPKANENRMGLLLLGVAALCISIYFVFVFAA